ncbi:hypothetical protein [Vibrio nigripulchritudo]|uniref:hypothetical protein n=1 Tax=Vibrio nigripulchritudo TaxID=28173 RepID=UPI0002EB04CC|nr:hypothetical protein [Vibrio nigripulchritudo]
MLKISGISYNTRSSYSLIFIFLSLATFSQIIEKIIGLNIYPMAVSLLILAILLALKGLNLRVNIGLLIAFLLISIHFVVSYFFNSCNLGVKQVLSLLMLLSVFIVYNNRVIFNTLSEPILHYMIVGFTVFFLLLSIVGYSVIDIFAHETRSKVGLYSEYSHLAIFSLPSTLYLFFLGNRVYALTCLSIIFWFAFSSTAIVFLFIATNLLLYIRYGFLSLALTFPIVTFLAALLMVTFGMHDTIARATGIINTGSDIQDSALSSIVWLNGWSMLYEYLVNTNGLGVGINQMGCGVGSQYGIYTKDITQYLGAPLNASDGSFLFSKIVSEFGIFGFGIVIYILLKVRQFLSKITFKELVQDKEISFGFVCCVSILVLLFVRGMGYFNFPFIMCLCWVFFSSNLKDNRV